VVKLVKAVLLGMGHRLRHLYRLGLAQLERVSDSKGRAFPGAHGNCACLGYARRRCKESAYSARTIATRITAYIDPVSIAIFTDAAPSWAKAAAMAVAARNGMNMGVLSGLVVKG